MIRVTLLIRGHSRPPSTVWHTLSPPGYRRGGGAAAPNSPASSGMHTLSPPGYRQGGTQTTTKRRT